MKDIKTCVKGFREIRLVEYKKGFVIIDNCSLEYSNVIFIDFVKALNVYNRLEEKIGRAHV